MTATCDTWGCTRPAVAGVFCNTCADDWERVQDERNREWWK